MDLNNLPWETVETPSGSFIGWGTHQGQHVTGAVLDYEAEGGTAFDGSVCPRLTVELMAAAASFNKDGDRTDYNTGDIVVLNCGLANLKRGVKYANLEPGDVVRVELVGFEKVDKGTVKLFDVKVARGAAKGRVKQQAPAQQQPVNGNGFGAAPSAPVAQFGAPQQAAPFGGAPQQAAPFMDEASAPF